MRRKRISSGNPIFNKRAVRPLGQFFKPFMLGQVGHLRRHVHHQRLAGINPTPQAIGGRDQLTQLQRQTPASAQRRAEAGAVLIEGITHFLQLIQLATRLRPFFQATQQRQVAQAMQQPRAVTAFRFQIQQPRQGPGVLGGVQRQFPVALGIVRQIRNAEAGAALEGQDEDQVHALPRAELVQRLGHGLHRAATLMLGSAVGRRNQHASNLRVGADLFFQQFQIQASGVEATLDRHLHIGHQRRAFGQIPSPFQKGYQGLPRPRNRHIAGGVFSATQQQPLQTLGQAFPVQRLGQIRRRRQGHDLTHTGAVITPAHQNER